jgi:hypothetical protein
MSDVTSALSAHRAAVNDLMVAAEQSGGRWATPRAPGKWSPSQIVEHVARALEESAQMVAGQPSKFPTLPAFVRPVVRGVFFNRVVRKGTFPRAKTSKAFNPASGPATVADGRQRLEGALAAFEAACRDRAASGLPASSGIFGRVSVADYVKFQEAHARHHRKQV